MEVGDRPRRIRVRLANMEESHIPDVVRIENESFSTPWSTTIFLRALRDPNTRCIVALLGDQVAGYAVFWVVGDFAELGDIAVERRCRGHGIGDTLLSAVIETCAVLGVRSLFLEVRESNAPARRLYEKRNFAEISRRKGYYTKPVEDALVFGLDIQAGEGRGGSPG